MVYVEGKHIPLLFTLMKNKREESYKKLLNKVPTLSPSLILLDFERSSKNAFKEAFKFSKINGCLFHFGQNIWRKLQDLSLSSLYKTDSGVNLNIRCMLSLSMVPVDEVLTYYTTVKYYLQTQVDFSKYEEIFRYFEETYLKTQETIEFFNSFERIKEELPRTTNGLEGFHRSLNNLFVQVHPDIGLFCEQLMKESVISNKKIVDYLYNIKKKKITKDSQKNISLKQILDRFEELNVIDYLKSVSYVMKWALF